MQQPLHDFRMLAHHERQQDDHHPDHRRLFKLGQEASYYAGLKNYPCKGERWRPEAVAWVDPIHR